MISISTTRYRITPNRAADNLAANRASETLLPRWVRLAGTCPIGLWLAFFVTGCATPVGTNKAAPAIAYRQIHENAVSRSEPSPGTIAALHRFDQVQQFAKAPDAALELIHAKAMESKERDLLFALAELNYLVGDRVRRSVKPWEPREAQEYYLASSVYAWFYLFGEAADPPPGPFDQTFRAACDLYNFGLGWALTERRSTNSIAVLAGGTRRLPIGSLQVEFTQARFPWAVSEFDRFVLAHHFLVRGLSMRNRQSGLGVPLVAVAKAETGVSFSRCSPATVMLRIQGGLAELKEGKCKGTLELYSTFDTDSVEVGAQPVPLETDSTASLAYGLDQSLLWRLGMMQFLSFEEKVPTDVYLNHPYQAGKIPVVFVHGTFSSPVKWAEMFNTLSADPVLRKQCQFWWFVYNSGNPTSYSAVKLREALTAKIREIDPEGRDPALRQMVVIGHSQGGLLTKLTATDTGDELLNTMLGTNRLDQLGISPEQQVLLRRYTCFEPLPFVGRVVFISTPHRGSYLANNLARRLARKFVTLPSRLVNASKEFAGLSEKLDIPKDFHGTPTSLDSMSPKNPVQLKLADIPVSSRVKAHSIVAVRGNGDYHRGKDGLVAYGSAHVDYVESELVVRGPHSCQDLPPAVEEVRRILHAHVNATRGAPVDMTGAP